MAEIITKTVVELEKLGLYHELNKAYIDAGLAKKWESATFDETTRKVSFYTVAQPSGDAAPAFEFTLPEVDFTEVYDKIAEVEEKVNANTEAIEAINNEETGILKQAKDYADGKDASIKEAKDAADAINATIGTVDEGKTVVQMIADAKDAATYDDEEVRGLISDNADAIADEKERAEAAEKANADAIAKLNGDATTEGSVAKAVKDSADAINATIGIVEEGKTVVGMIEEAITEATYDDTEVRELIADNAEAIEAHKTAIDNTVSTLVGDDAGKSVRTIANEELAAQLLSGDADADFQTLQELAAWLEGHPEDVATINLNISNLQKLVGTIPEGSTATDIVGYIAEAVAAEKSRAEGVESGLDTRLKAVEEAVGEGNVETQINNAIAELDADVTSDTVEEGKGIQVQIVEIDGKVTNVAVTGNYDNVYETSGTAESKVKELADGQVATNTAAIAENKTAVEAAQADATSALEAVNAIQYATEDEIRALWS